MSGEVRPVLVRVPAQLCDELTAAAADRGVSRHALMVERLSTQVDRPVELRCLACGAVTQEPEEEFHV